MRDLQGKVAVVTGAASGIGLGLAERFAAEGMHVVLADIEQGALDSAVERLRAGGADAIGVATDVTSEASVQALADRTVEAFGTAHVVCNNAGVSTGAPFWEFPPETFEWVMAVNFWGIVYGCRAFLPILRAQGEGHIVNTSSTVTSIGYMPTGTAYVASKFAVSGFTETLYRELRMAGEPVGVSLLIPGPTDTRIPDAERNRPAGVPGLTDNPTLVELVKGLKQGGSIGLMPPSEVAALVVEALGDGRFHVVTHPDASIPALQARLDWLRTGEQPPPSPVLEAWPVNDRD